MTVKTKRTLLIAASACLAAASAVLYALGHDTVHLIPCFFASCCLVLCAHFAENADSAKKYIIAACVVYLIGILTATVFRRGIGFILPFDGKSAWLKAHIEWKPFGRVKYYCKHIYSPEFLFCFTNLFGNLAVFAPFALFLPKISGRANTRGGFFAMMASLLLFVEIGQLVFMTGTFDVDDLLLNMGGAWVAYELLQKDTVKESADEKLHLRP